MICWGNRNTSEFQNGFYIGPCKGPGYDELRSPSYHAAQLAAQESASQWGAVAAALDRLAAAIEKMKP